MNDSWDKLRRAKEDEYFDKENKNALKRIRADDSKPRLSPITGDPMEQVLIDGVTVDRCKTSGGIWLDAGELEEILKQSQAKGGVEGDWFKNFFASIFSK